MFNSLKTVRMKITLYSLLALSLGVSTFAQQDFFVLTGKDASKIVFSDFRALDIKKGISGEVFLNSESKPKIFSEVRNMYVTDENKSGNKGALATQMATLATDGKGNLIYMPLLSGDIYVLNNRTKEITLVESAAPKTVSCDIKTHFTRMTTAADGTVYALTNSGSQLLQISNRTGKYTVKDLGAVIDDASNGNILLSKMQTGFGGDMIADSDNNLYVFSASGNVFKVNIQTLKAELLGSVKGLPEKFSLNGAAVNSAEEVVVASAKGQGFYTVDMETLHAVPLAKNFDLNIYDLASSYQLSGKGTAPELSLTQVYPTKVDEGYINLRLSDEVQGSVTFEIYDAAGKNVFRKLISTNNESVQKFDLNFLNSGVYIVNVWDSKSKTLLTRKILVTE